MIRLLTWNISFLAMKGARKRGTYHCLRTIYRHDAVPCSDGNLTCQRNIMDFLVREIPNHEIVTIIEASTPHIEQVLNEIGPTGKTFVRFYHRTASKEALIVGYPTAYRVAFQGLFTLELDNSCRPLAIIVFQNPNLILVAVHLPHPTREVTADDINQSLLKLLEEILGPLDAINLVITGDFNNETPYGGDWHDHLLNPKQPTCYTLIAEQYYRKGERPLTLTYDRFVTSPPIRCRNARTHRDLAMERGMLSDHLPISADILVSSKTGEHELNLTSIQYPMQYYPDAWQILPIVPTTF